MPGEVLAMVRTSQDIFQPSAAVVLKVQAVSFQGNCQGRLQVGKEPAEHPESSGLLARGSFQQR